VKGVALVIALACATEVAAQPAAATAEAMFKQGKQLMAAGKLPEACAAFEASQNAEPAISTLLNLANCREKNGELASAWGLFRDAERQTRSGTDAASKQMHATAAARATSLEPRIPHLTIVVAKDRRVDGLQIVRDSKAIEPVAWNQPLPIDGGKHVIEASAPGRTPWKMTVEVGLHDDNKTIEVPELAAQAAHKVVVVDTAPAPVPRRHERRIAPWIATGVAVGAAGAGIGFEFWARSTYNNALAEPDPVKQGSTWQSANTKRYLADGLGGVAAASGVLAIWLWMRSGDDTAVQPVVGPGNAGLVFIGSW
jgi:hypothetical protein